MEKKFLESAKLFTRINLGLLAITFAFLVSFLQIPLENMDDHLTNAMIFDLIAFPFCFTFGFLLQLQDKTEISIVQYIGLVIATLITVTASIGGLLEYVFHFSRLMLNILMAMISAALFLYILTGTLTIFIKPPSKKVLTSRSTFKMRKAMLTIKQRRTRSVRSWLKTGVEE